MAGTVVADLFAKLGLLPDVKSWAKGDKLISGIKTGLAGIAGVFAVSGIVGMIKDTIALGGELHDTSQAIGVGVEALQELRYAAGFAGVAADDMTIALGKFGKGMTDAQQTGKGPFADALRTLRVSMRDLKGETLDQNLEVIADKFAKMPDGAKKSSLAVDLFGKAGRKLIPFLNEGSAGIVKLRNEAQELGVVLDEKTVGELDNLGDDVDRFKLTLGGLKNQAVVTLLPLLQELVTGLLGWIKANKEIIRTTIAGAMQVVVAILKVFGKALGVVTKVIGFFIENAELGKSVLIALGIVLGYFAVEAAAAWIAAFAPVILAIAAIAALVLGVRQLIKNWDKIWPALKRTGDRIKRFFTQDIPNAIKSGLAAAFTFIAGMPVIAQLMALVAGIKAILNFGDSLSTKHEQMIQDATARPGETRAQTKARFRDSLSPEDRADYDEQMRLIDKDRARSTPSRVRMMPATGSGGPLSFAPVIQINGVTDPEAVGAIAEKRMRGVFNDWLVQTEEAIG